MTCDTHDVFGEMLTGKQTGFGYNGEWFDAATGMLNLRARQYEPAMMRFGQEDSIGTNAWMPKSANHYVFAWNDPINLTDPSGLRPADQYEAKQIEKAAIAKAKTRSVPKNGCDNDHSKPVS